MGFFFGSQSQVWEGKATTEEKNRDHSKVDLKPQKPTEVSACLNKENLPAAAQTSTVEVKLTEIVPVTKTGDDVKDVKPVTVSEKKPVANGASNGC